MSDQVITVRCGNFFWPPPISRDKPAQRGEPLTAVVRPESDRSESGHFLVRWLQHGSDIIGCNNKLLRVLSGWKIRLRSFGRIFQRLIIAPATTGAVAQQMSTTVTRARTPGIAGE